MYINLHRVKQRLKWLLPVVIITLVLTSNWFWRFFYPFGYQDMVLREARVSSLDPYLVAALIHTESRFSARAESGRGARGVMQIMPDTGKWAAERMAIPDFNPDMLFEPAINIKIGCWYLADLQREFGGNMIIALAAYNAGRGNVKRWLTENIWDGQLASVDQIPFPETRNYVINVTKSYQKYKTLYDEVDTNLQGKN